MAKHVSIGMLHEPRRDAAALEVRMHVEAVDVAIGIQLEESGDAIFEDSHEGAFQLAAFSPVVRIGSRVGPSQCIAPENRIRKLSHGWHG